MANSTVVRRQPPRRAARPPARPGRTRHGNRRRRSARRGPRRSFGPFVVIAVLIAVVGLVWQHRGGGPDLVSGQCTVPGTNLSLSTEQSANASTIAAVARARGLPARATVIALATAQQESRLHNLDHGDRDSLGLFQQRPSQGWGTPAQVQDPVYAAGKFFDHLVEIPGWDTGRLTEVAQAVQRSAFPEAYEQWEPMATELAAVLVAKPTGSGVIDCT